MSEIKATRDEQSIITVMGVGGAGGNAVNRMWNQGIQGVTFMVCNTDRQALDISPVEYKIQLGKDGLGAGSDPETGRSLALETVDDIRQILEETGTKMIFIAAGMGGGTGTGASPVIAKLAKEMGLLTVAVVTSPFAVEGKPRYEQAWRGIDELRQIVDSLLIVNNENILELYGRLSLKQAFGKADEILWLATKGIAEIITIKSNLVNVDFADVLKVMRESGRAHMAVAVADGENRAQQAAKASLSSPLLDSNRITGAKNILLNFSVGESDSLSLQEVYDAMNFIQAHACTRDADGTVHTANIIWGTSEKPELGDKLELVMVATGLESEAVDPQKTGAPIPVPQPVSEVEAPQPPKQEGPVSPIPPRPVPPRPPQEPATLGARSNRYDNIGAKLAVPAYQTRNTKFIVQSAKIRKEVLRDDHIEAAEPTDEPQNNSLF